MKLTIIETGLVPEPIRADWPDYPAMFRSLLSAADPDLTFETVSVANGEALPDPATLEAFLVTGSPAGVYDPEPWMEPLFDFIRWAAAERTPGLGICFGHQAIARAMGADVRKAPQGWGVGRHTYDWVSPPDWMDDRGKALSLAVSHQDQVLSQPVGTRLVARSEFTPFAALAYETAPFLTFQAHPEFTPEYAAALQILRRDRIGEDRVNAALATLEKPLDGAKVAGWMVEHIRRKAVERAGT